MNSVGKVINGKFEEFANTSGKGVKDLTQRVDTAEANIGALEEKNNANASEISSIKEMTQNQGIELEGKVSEGGDISSNTVTFEQAVERAGIVSGDTMSVAFGKLAKYCADLESSVLDGLTGNVQDQLDVHGIEVRKELKAAGWYRLLRFSDVDSDSQNISAAAVSIDLTLCRNYNYAQPETIVMTIEVGYSEKPICVIQNRGAYDTHQIFRDIRIAWDPNDEENYLEVFYNSNQPNGCSAYLSVKDSYLSNFRSRVMNFESNARTDVRTIWQYTIPITKDIKTNGLRKIFTGDMNIDDYFDGAHVGSYGHHSGTLDGIPSGLSSIGVWDTEYSIGDGDTKYLKQTYHPYDKSVFVQRTRINNTVSDWSIFYPGSFQTYSTVYTAITAEDWQLFIYHLWYHIQNTFNWSNIGEIDIVSPTTWNGQSHGIGRFHYNPLIDTVIGTVQVAYETYGMYWNPSKNNWDNVIRRVYSSVGGGGNKFRNYPQLR